MLCTSKGNVFLGLQFKLLSFKVVLLLLVRAVIRYTCTLVYIQLEGKGNKLSIVDPSIGKYEIYIATLF